ncbi:membrane alanyl aminopeptidase-like [Culicoides brevitarsis]|uniref:membrane alanyl aminopeptidase-like n=1 Tax=Culicoides brevitarsis TaxID=469753 RepID=UPI00307C2348
MTNKSFNFALILIVNFLFLTYAHLINAPKKLQISKNDADVDPSDFRLSRSVYPSRYVIEIEPFFKDEGANKAFTFNGNVKILLKTEETGVKEIELHMDESISVESISLLDNQGMTVAREETIYQNETEKLKIPLKKEMKSGVQYTLEIEYEGKFKSGGVFSVEFKPMNARKIFPVFDEPLFKAVFQLNIIRSKDFQVSLSNMQLQEVTPIENSTKVRETFKATPPMSPHLVTFVINHDFKSKQSTDKSFGVWVRASVESQLTYSYYFGQQILHEMGIYLNYIFTKVPEIQKIDLIAMPEQQMNAVESWGAMTFRENLLLCDENDTNAADKQQIATTIGHKIAQLWFGNLVTGKWWSETWLNEAFGTYFGAFGTAMIEKEWNLPEQFVVEALQKAMEADSARNVRPLTDDEVFTREDVEKMLDEITNFKGAAILRMIEHHMGAENFQKGLQEYLKKYEYQAVKPYKLFTILDEVNPEAKIMEIFEPWTSQAGFPYLTVTSNDNNTLKISKNRFLFDEKEPEDVSKWSIPITFANREEHFTETATQVVYPNTQTKDFSIKLPENGTLGFYLLNVQQVGFYRVNYDEENWKSIRGFLKSGDFEKIHVLNRAQIVDDLFNFARNGILSYDFVMSIVDYVREEKNYIPWVSMFNGLSYLSRRIGLNSDYERFRKHVLYLTESLYKQLGFEPKPEETHLDTLLRTNLLNWMCKHGHEECLMLAIDEFDKLMNDKNYSINPNIRVPVYCNAVRRGSGTEFAFLWEKYMTTNVATEKINLLNALGCTKQQSLVNNLMDKILSDDIKMPDKKPVFANIYTSNHENVDLVFNYLTQNWQKWENVMGSIGEVLTELSDHFTTETQVKRLEDFSKIPELSENNVKLITKAVENAKKFLEWDEKRLVEVRSYFKMLDDTGNSAKTVSISYGLILGIACYLLILS